MNDFNKIITKPSLIVLKNICEENIKKMTEKAIASKCIFRPHFKTHQSAKIGELFKKYDVNKITVSSISMAQHFTLYGWSNILVAFVFNHREIDVAKELNKKIKLYLIADSTQTVRFLAQNIKQEINLYVKIDTGNHRTGVDIDDFNSLDIIIDEIKKHRNINLIGFLGHCGHTYYAKNKNEIINIWNTTLIKMKILKNRYSSIFNELIVSLGDTPSCNIISNFYGVDEVRPGNFVYNDLMQIKLGTCTYNDVAVLVACPVVSINKNKKQLVIYGGAIHFSKEHILNENGEIIYGIVSKINNGIIEPTKDCYLTSLTQEHGIVSCNSLFINSINIGDIIYVIPVHSCLTNNQLLNSIFYY
jgi:D-serine deaminase-like pyridoxal phosphate-dependent protein